jgi:hypothetical protein
MNDINMLLSLLMKHKDTDHNMVQILYPSTIKGIFLLMNLKKQNIK